MRILQGRRIQYGWCGFGCTTFWESKSGGKGLIGVANTCDNIYAFAGQILWLGAHIFAVHDMPPFPHYPSENFSFPKRSFEKKVLRWSFQPTWCSYITMRSTISDIVAHARLHSIRTRCKHWLHIQFCKLHVNAYSCSYRFLQSKYDSFFLRCIGVHVHVYVQRPVNLFQV